MLALIKQTIRHAKDNSIDVSLYEAVLLVNGFGVTPLMELYLVYDIAKRLLEEKGVKIVRSLVGNYVACLDMAGCSITLSMMNDDLLALWVAPVHTTGLRWGC